MTLNRGDIVMTRFPHAGGTRGKKRPAVIIQAEGYNAKLKHFIVAEITKNLAAASDPASFLIDVSTPEGKATGIGPEFGRLLLVPLDRGRGGHHQSDRQALGCMNAQLDACLKAALQLP